MSPQTHVKAADLRGYSRLVIDATLGMTGIVETMHRNIARTPLVFLEPGDKGTGNTSGITGLVYQSIRAISGVVGLSIDKSLELLAPLLDASMIGRESSYVREGLLALVNGVVGDHLADSGNPLAIQMNLRNNGRTLTMDPCSIAEAIPTANHKLLVMAHGLCMNDLEFLRQGHDHGAALARDHGYTPVYLHYNSGKHISLNGREFADQLEALVKAWPMRVEELVIAGFSMGGLVTRSACHYAQLAGHTWPKRLKRIMFIGTPHHGAPLERGGNKLQWLANVTPYTAPLGRLGMLRSAGITDLRHGSLTDEDWQGSGRFDHHHDTRQPVPLPAGVRCYAMAATTGVQRGDLSDTLLGDGIVFLKSALGQHEDARHALDFPESRRWTAYGTSHLGMLNSPEIYARLRTWLAEK